MSAKFNYLSIESLRPGQYQPRQDFDTEGLHELADSIAAQGLIEPLVVRPIAQDVYEIIAGERRFRAAKIAGLNELPCMIGNYSDKEACALTLIENIQRKDLNLIEEAAGYKRLIDEFHYRQDELAILLGKSRSHIANILRCLSLTALVQEKVREKLLSLGHARVLVSLPVGVQEQLAELCIDEQWSVRQLEEAVRNKKGQCSDKPKDAKSDRDVQRLQELLSEQVGAPVEIEDGKDQGGWLKVKFFDNDTLAGLLERLGLRYD